MTNYASNRFYLTSGVQRRHFDCRVILSFGDIPQKPIFLNFVNIRGIWQMMHQIASIWQAEYNNVIFTVVWFLVSEIFHKNHFFNFVNTGGIWQIMHQIASIWQAEYNDVIFIVVWFLVSEIFYKNQFFCNIHKYRRNLTNDASNRFYLTSGVQRRHFLCRVILSFGDILQKPIFL